MIVFVKNYIVGSKAINRLRLYGSLLIALLAVTTPQNSLAVPAYRGLQSYTQPDGSEVEFRKIGDEFSHILLSEDDYLLTYGVTGLEYGKISDNGLILPTGILFQPGPLHPNIDKSLLTRISDPMTILNNLSVKNGGKQNINNRFKGPGRIQSSFPRTGKANALVILVEYQDVKFNLTDPHSYYDGMLNKQGFSEYGGTGCAKEYFELNSNGQFSPQFDVYGPVTLPNNREYYGGNDERGSDKHASEMVSHALKILDPDVDFKRYDMNSDGEVDNVYVIYAGQGEATYGGPDTVWPHSFDLLKDMIFVIVDGLYVNHYACCNEWLNDEPDGVGTFIHEFSHVLGLPDLYATNGARLSATPGNWSVLDYGPYNNGGHTPPNYSAYERYAMGWVEPEILKTPKNLNLLNLSESNQVAIIPVEGNANEFFLIENRQQKNWDKYLPGHGMMVWHVDYDAAIFQAGATNNDPKHQRVDIIEANGKADGLNYDTMTQYPFPGPTRNTSLDFESIPQLATWSGADTGVALSDIEETEDGRIVCRVNGGVYNIDTPEWVDYSFGTDSLLTLNWKEVPGAELYELEVMACFDGESGVIVNNMGAGGIMSLPEDWTSSSTKVYSTSGNYGEAAPSFKMEKAEDFLMSPVLNADINNISFWMKGIQTSGSTIEVLGLKAGDWVSLGSETPGNKQGQIYELAVDQPGIRQVKFIYNMQKGRVALDDVVISYGNPDFILEGYSPKVLKGVTTHSVDCSAVTPDKVRCRMRARNGDDTSRWSETIEVDSKNVGITEVSSNSSVTVQGHTVMSEGQTILVYDITGRKIATGFEVVTLPCRGIYIAVAGQDRIKIHVK